MEIAAFDMELLTPPTEPSVYILILVSLLRFALGHETDNFHPLSTLQENGIESFRNSEAPMFHQLYLNGNSCLEDRTYEPLEEFLYAMIWSTLTLDSGTTRVESL